METFRDGVLDFGALEDNALVVATVLFVDEVLGVAILSGAAVGRRWVVAWRDLDARDDEPLEQREHDPHHRAHRNQNLRPDIWQNRRAHSQKSHRLRLKSERERERGFGRELETKGKRKKKRENRAWNGVAREYICRESVWWKKHINYCGCVEPTKRVLLPDLFGRLCF